MLATQVSPGVLAGSFVLAALASFSSLASWVSALVFSSSNLPLYSVLA